MADGEGNTCPNLQARHRPGQKTLAQTLAIPELREQLAMREDLEAIGGTPEALAKLMRPEFDRWGKIIRTHGIKGE